MDLHSLGIACSDWQWESVNKAVIVDRHQSYAAQNRPFRVMLKTIITKYKTEAGRSHEYLHASEFCDTQRESHARI